MNPDALPGRPAHDRHRNAVEVGEPQFGTIGKRMRRVHPHEQRLRAHVLIAEPGETVGLEHDRDVELAGNHLTLQQLAQRGVDLDLDARIAGGERFAELEPMIAMAGDRDADSEPPGRLDRLTDRERLLGCVERGPRLIEELAPGIGELDPPRHAH